MHYRVTPRRRKHRVWKKVILGLALVIVAAIAFALVLVDKSMAELPTSGSLAGRVTSAKGLIPYAMPGLSKVVVTAQPGGHSTTTDRKGLFSLDLPSGVYDITFSRPGYEPYAEKAIVSASGRTLIFTALFVQPKAKPVAVLKGPAPSKGPIAYNTSVSIKASRSKNVSRHGIRWEVRDGDGEIVYDPYAVPATPLQLDPSPIPGSSPLDFSFTPPGPGRYTVTLFLRNELSAHEESSASVSFEAVNVPPEALPKVIAGPGRPQKVPSGVPKQGSGLSTVSVGDRVFLQGWAIDKNMPSPELYNPGGREPDTYGKNDDWDQRQFAWQWTLTHLSPSGGASDVTEKLNTSDGVLPATCVQRPWFTATEPGQYIATLTVTDQDPYSAPMTGAGSVTVRVLPAHGEHAADGSAQFTSDESCAKCHFGSMSVAGNMSCQSCHGPAGPHMEARGDKNKRATMEVSYDSGLCGQCHSEYHEWEKSRHADGYPFGYYEIAKPLLLNCAKCHYTAGFADAVGTSASTGIPFGEVAFKKPMYPGGPMFFDFSKLPAKSGEGIACTSCHDSHKASTANVAGLRVDKSELCGTCHEEKWQNVLLEGTAAKVGSAYEYPGSDYDVPNPHNTDKKCILCHMSQTGEAGQTVDANDAAIGGHTLRMRDAGPDGRLGGFGPSYDDPSISRQPFGADDVLNTGVCQTCHPDAKDFNIDGKQAEIYALWVELGDLLKASNSGALPGFRPGDKCATCHRGGTVPFDHDPDLVLENAYTNYKLVKNDRSWGVHNYEYTRRLLEDSIESVRSVRAFASGGAR